MNNNELVNALRSGNQPVSVVFNNQERLENLAGRIAEQIEADSLSLLKAFQDEEFLKNASFDRESALGMYVPNKYELYWNTSAEEFRDRMQKEYNRFWNQERLQKAEKNRVKAFRSNCSGFHRSEGNGKGGGAPTCGWSVYEQD